MHQHISAYLSWFFLHGKRLWIKSTQVLSGEIHIQIYPHREHKAGTQRAALQTIRWVFLLRALCPVYSGFMLLRQTDLNINAERPLLHEKSKSFFFWATLNTLSQSNVWISDGTEPFLLHLKPAMMFRGISAEYTLTWGTHRGRKDFHFLTPDLWEPTLWRWNGNMRKIFKVCRSAKRVKRSCWSHVTNPD